MITAEEIKKFYLFSDWSDEELATIIPYLEEEELEKDQTLFKQNDYPDKLYFVKSGCIEIRLMVSESEETHLARIKTGEILGEIAIVDDKPRSATAVAFISTSLISLTKEKYSEFLAKNDKALTNKFLISLLKELGFRLRSADDAIRHSRLYI